MVCSAWRSGVRRVWGLPNLTHHAFIPLISGRPPLYDEIIKRMLSFSRTCLLSDNQFVNFVARYAVWYGRMRSLFATNAFHCCQWFGVALEDLWAVSSTYISKAVEFRYDISQISTVHAILELSLFVLVVLNLVIRAMVRAFLHAKLKAFIQFLCTS